MIGLIRVRKLAQKKLGAESFKMIEEIEEINKNFYIQETTLTRTYSRHWNMSAFFGSYFLKRRAFCLYAAPK